MFGGGCGEDSKIGLAVSFRKGMERESFAVFFWGTTEGILLGSGQFNEGMEVSKSGSERRTIRSSL